tara:strand:- start:199 stop:450 length:252 start_codon:yes stop_codon:yes gene_type:complete
MKTGEDREELKNIYFDNELEEDSDLTTEEKIDQVIDEDTEMYNFGWSNYSEITNGRFAMIGFLAIILIEFFSQQSFLKWAGIL